MNILLPLHRSDVRLAQRLADRTRTSRAAVLRRCIRAGLELEMGARLRPAAPDAPPGTVARIGVEPDAFTAVLNELARGAK